MQQAELTGARLAGADLSGAVLKGARLTRADARGTKLDSVFAADAVFDSAELSGAAMSGEFERARFPHADLASASVQMYGRGIRLTGADLTNATLEVWLPDASAEDLRELEAVFQGAANYLIERLHDRDHQPSCRLYHHALDEYLCDRCTAHRPHRVVTDALTGLVPMRAGRRHTQVSVVPSSCGCLPPLCPGEIGTPAQSEAKRSTLAWTLNREVDLLNGVCAGESTKKGWVAWGSNPEPMESKPRSVAGSRHLPILVFTWRGRAL
ncbi:pentapeptide repeat-containing protein [Amycolatopsis sp. VS8301801F10]|uniref:pentapeptide repeat-containing protein n=1 Tax=Amycolatopsis sp. VS8301801F10 TaxID=2652442 RepID=UPI0038FD0A19